MPDKLPAETPTSRAARFLLSDHRVLALQGRDAVAFAQAQCMNEVAALPVGHWQWNGWLTPKGRVIALFALIKLADDTIWLLLPDADPAALAAQLQRYVFRSKVTLAARDELLVSGAFAAPEQATGAGFSGAADDAIELDMGGAGGPRALRITVTRARPRAAPGTLPDLWRAFDLRHGLPRLPADQVEHWTPQMLSLDRLRAFSVKKGCYPGQEIVARTHFLGQSKRGLALLESDAPLAEGSEVHAGERALGKVVSVAPGDGRHLALAVLPLAREAAELQVDEVAVQEIPLLDGLAR